VTGTIIKFPNPEEIIQRSKLKEQESYDTSINSICDSVIDFLNAWVEQLQKCILVKHSYLCVRK
jgi:hypothetical protein